MAFGNILKSEETEIELDLHYADSSKTKDILDAEDNEEDSEEFNYTSR